MDKDRIGDFGGDDGLGNVDGVVEGLVVDLACGGDYGFACAVGAEKLLTMGRKMQGGHLRIKLEEVGKVPGRAGTVDVPDADSTGVVGSRVACGENFPVPWAPRKGL